MVHSSNYDNKNNSKRSLVPISVCRPIILVESISDFPQYLQANSATVYPNRPKHLPPEYFPTYYTPVMLS